LIEMMDALIVKRVKRQISATEDTIKEGERNDRLFRFACRLGRLGLTEDMQFILMSTFNQKLCVSPIEDEELAMLVKSAHNRIANVDPAQWLLDWTPHITKPTQMRVAALLSASAEFISGELSPANEIMIEKTGCWPNHYFQARKGLAELGCIRVTNRGRNLSPIIELVPRPKEEITPPMGTNSVPSPASSYARGPTPPNPLI
jgi:hypothetical protein